MLNGGGVPGLSILAFRRLTIPSVQSAADTDRRNLAHCRRFAMLEIFRSSSDVFLCMRMRMRMCDIVAFWTAKLTSSFGLGRR